MEFRVAKVPAAPIKPTSGAEGLRNLAPGRVQERATAALGGGRDGHVMRAATLVNRIPSLIQNQAATADRRNEAPTRWHCKYTWPWTYMHTCMYVGSV